MTNVRELISRFLAAQNLMVISSISPEGDPQSAVVEFAETEDFKIVFDTYDHFRKYQNFKSNSSVALVFDDRTAVTVQYEGSVRELSSSEMGTYIDIYLRKLPGAARFVERPETRWFCVVPKWIRYTDLTNEPWVIHEIKFT